MPRARYAAYTRADYALYAALEVHVLCASRTYQASMTDQGRWAYAFKPRRTDIACPECTYAPTVGTLWTCAPDGCGGLFDTFETQAHCPHCQAEFAWTMCPACGKASAHQAWYRRAG
jgi:hypothetical protein